MFGGWKCSVFHTNHHKKNSKKKHFTLLLPKVLGKCFCKLNNLMWDPQNNGVFLKMAFLFRYSAVIHCEFSLEKELDFKQHLWLRYCENALQSRRSMVYLCASVWWCTLICWIAQKHLYPWIVSHFHTTDSIAMHRIILHPLLFLPESYK